MAKSRSNRKSAPPKKALSVGCLVFFALPFLAVGFGVTYWTASTALQYSAMQSWVEVPAKIEKASLEQTRGRKGRSKYKAKATYTYEYEGKTFTGDRVSLHNSSDNFGDFQRKTAAQLEERLRTGKPVPCFVNPQDPTESVLYPQIRWEMMAFFTIFAAVFGCVGFGMLTAALVSARRTFEHVTSDVPKDEPWRMRPDWASGTISSLAATASFVPALAVVSLWWWIGSAPLWLKLPTLFASSDSGWRWLMFAFPLIGVLLLLMLAYHLVHQRKYGESILQLASTPGVIGGQLAGVVQIPQTIRPDSGFQLKVSCIEIQSGRKNEDREVVVWQDERLVENAMHGGAGTTAVPVLFAIPYGAKESSRSTSSRDIRWILDVFARTSGVDYRTRFEVPVFKTAASRADFKLDESLTSDFISVPSTDVVLRDAGIVKEPLPGEGVRLVFPAARNPGSAFTSTLILAGLVAIVWFLRSIGAPIIFAIVFGLIGLLMLVITLELWFYRSVVEARSDGITFRGGLLGIGRRRFWPASEIKKFRFDHSMSSGRNVWKNIEVEIADKKTKTIAKSIGSKLAQEAVVNELNAALGRG
jgi:hypothetical protein